MHTIDNLIENTWLRRGVCGLTLVLALVCMNPDLLLGPAQAANGYPAASKATSVGQASAEQCHPNGPKHGEHRPKIDFGKELGLDAKTAANVQQILQQQREKRRALIPAEEAMRAKHDALRQETDQRLAQVLNQTQLAKLHQLMPRPPRPAHPPRPDQAGAMPPPPPPPVD